MKRFFVTLAACAVLALSLLGVAGFAQAQPLTTSFVPTLLGAETTASPEKLIEQVREQILPQFESILSPEQRDRLQTEIVDAKVSLRKAFKKITLSTDQKTRLATVFKSLPKKDIFASLTPEQKKGLFSKKDFMPTPEAISDKINAKMQMAKDKGAMMPTPEAISQKINAKMKLAQEKAATKAAPAPTAEKATEALNAIESKVAD
ncbi:MAG: hypothetical protein KME45_22175 [Stenomitos rutilans HA7619-LM2]|jgi:hypothetical protein|nr:hypothetical protein [Stenomitos rutilans HA7619-LM2]